jgi:hypothetical protein
MTEHRFTTKGKVCLSSLIQSVDFWSRRSLRLTWF